MSERRVQGELSRATYCYEAVQRVFRPTMVEHIRRRLTEAYPDDWPAKLKACFGKQWDEIKESSERFEAVRALDVAAHDDFDMLGVNNFHPVASKHFAILFPPVVGTSPIAQEERRASILRSLKEVKDVRDGMSHPVTEDFTVPDAIATMRAAQRVIRLIDPAAAEELAGLISEVLRLPTEGVSPRQVATDKVDVDVSPREQASDVQDALEALFLRFESAEVYTSLIRFFEANAAALEPGLPHIAEAHRGVAEALREVIRRSEQT